MINRSLYIYREQLNLVCADDLDTKASVKSEYYKRIDSNFDKVRHIIIYILIVRRKFSTRIKIHN